MNLEKERELINACKTDLHNFSEIYVYYVADIYRYAYSLSNDKHKAEDITSETFIKALKHVSYFTSQANVSVKSWLMRICRNICFDQSKKKAEQMYDFSFDDTLNQSIDESFIDTLMNKELIDHLVGYIKTLPDVEQEVITLRVWQELSFTEIASILERSEGAIKMMYYRCLKKVHTKFTKERNMYE